jgi:uncharacterized protein YneF (UPF0154 family)
LPVLAGRRTARRHFQARPEKSEPVGTPRVLHDTILPRGYTGSGTTMKPAEDLRSQLIRSMSFAMTVGLELACVLLVCVLLGHYLDTKFHSSPWGLLVGILLGVVGGGWLAYRMAMRVLK